MKKIILFLFIIVSINNIVGQELPQIIPPSPNAAALGEYADIPVSNYTGVPNISIPLFNIKSGNIELPITLSYHASGIKVAQEASWVGLGWALNAGGVITRQVRGFDDFAIRGYISTPLPPSTADNLPDWSGNNYQTLINEYYQYLNSNVISDRIDGEPDIFYYNFLGYSGKVVFEQQSYINGNVVAVSLDQNNLIFSYNRTSKQWTVTDGNGWKYYLGTYALHAIEKTVNYNYTTTSPINDISNQNIYNNRELMQYAQSAEAVETAWYLTKVETPEGDMVEFFYDDAYYQTLGGVNYSESLRQAVDHTLAYATGTNLFFPSTGFNINNYSFSQQLVEDVYLKSIHFKNGSIEFSGEARDDMRRLGTISQKPQRLKSAELFDLNGESIKKVDFNYSYFNSSIAQSNPNNAEDYLRLRLDSIEELFKEGTGAYKSKPPYVFTYNSTLLPDKLSFSIDYWGHFNNANNDNILNKYLYQELAPSQYGVGISTSYSYLESKKMLSPVYHDLNPSSICYFPGANRDVNEYSIKAAILEKIKYPTGASVNFSYEPNDYFQNGLYKEQRVPYFVMDDNVAGSAPEEAVDVFTIDETTLFYMDFHITRENHNPSSTFTGNAILKHSNGNRVIFLEPQLEFNNSGSYQTSRSIVLEPGTYELSVNAGNEHEQVVDINAHYYKKIPVNRKMAAGLRIHSITTQDEIDFLKQRVYTYESNGVSTGRLLSPTKYWYNEYFITSINNGLGSKSTYAEFLATYIIRTSESSIPLGNSAQGNAIGYDQVIISDVDLLGNSLGKSEYFYKNVDEIPAELFIPGMPNLINLSNGQLLHEIHLNQAGDKIKEKGFLYNMDQPTFKTIKGVKKHSLYGSPGNIASEIRFYDVYSEWWHPESSTETVFDINGNNPITTTTHYDYENPLHKNLTKSTTTDSKGETIITTNKYPHDLPSGTDQTTSTVISGMITDHVINPVIKSETRVDGNVIKGSVNNYTRETHTGENNVPSNMYLPLNVKTLKRGTTSEFENRIEFAEYDNNGRILQVQKPDGPPVSYVWGYNEEYPIAKVENATFVQVTAALGSLNPSYNTLLKLQNLSDMDDDRCLDTEICDEKNLRTALAALRGSLPNAMVTTYTYDPLVGVTSVTDPTGQTVYYEYDDFNRLEFVKDAEGKLVSENKYHYKN